jgi:hypothetical protein
MYDNIVQYAKDVNTHDLIDLLKVNYGSYVGANNKGHLFKHYNSEHTHTAILFYDSNVFFNFSPNANIPEGKYSAYRLIKHYDPNAKHLHKVINAKYSNGSQTVNIPKQPHKPVFDDNILLDNKGRRLYRICYSTKIIGKVDNNTLKRERYTFVNAKLSYENLIKVIRAGCCFSAYLKHGETTPSLKNVLLTDLLVFDVDNANDGDKMTIDTVINSNLINENFIALYTSSSHTEKLHKFRLIYEIPNLCISDPQTYTMIYKQIINADIKQADSAVSDIGRIWFGNPQTSKNSIILTKEDLK